jgi:DNA-binding transcriptional LysR family regulator
MELRQLEYFVAVAEEASFTRAAARVHVAQPGVSAQVRQLKRELGQPLFDRSGRAVRLTDAGAAVLPHAQAALGAVAGARLAVDELTGLVRGRVAVGMAGSLSSLDLPEVLAGFHHAHPAVEITLTEDSSDRLVAAVQSGQLDLACIGLGTTIPTGVEVQVVADEPLVAAVGPGDRLAGRSGVTLEELCEGPLVSLPRGTGLRASIDDACAAAGLRPRIALEASDPRVLAQLASRGLGAAILPAIAARAHPDLHAVVIGPPEMRGRLALAWRSDGPVSPAARALGGHARAALARDAEQRGTMSE